MVAANLALLGQIVRAAGRSGWFVGGMILATNLALCGVMGVVGRFRLIPLMAMFSTAALTEAFLYQAATVGRDSGWIVVVAVLGALALVAGWTGLRSARRRQHSRH
jgi:hypothetical protein